EDSNVLHLTSANQREIEVGRLHVREGVVCQLFIFIEVASFRGSHQGCAVFKLNGHIATQSKCSAKVAAGRKIKATPFSPCRFDRLLHCGSILGLPISFRAVFAHVEDSALGGARDRESTLSCTRQNSGGGQNRCALQERA